MMLKLELTRKPDTMGKSLENQIIEDFIKKLESKGDKGSRETLRALALQAFYRNI